MNDHPPENTMSALTRTFAALAALSLASTAQAQNPPAAAPAAPMTFFITSVGKGDGANVGGLAGADEHCKALADAASAPLPAGRIWRAYLSAIGTDGKAVNARDRIGAGPWHNAKGALIAANVADLHGDIIKDRNQINKVNALNEKGLAVNGVGDTPNTHDIMTGSDWEGRAIGGTPMNTTCDNWTSSATTGSAMLGHHDRTGGGSTSWNYAHPSRGCSQANLVATGGAGLLYCFAAN
ncbi:MAG: hypothetical protein ABI664_08685 [bacterium]